VSDINKYSGDKLLSQAEIVLFKTAADYEPASELFKKIKADKAERITNYEKTIKEMKDNVIKDKSYTFAIRIVKLYKYLCEEKKEFVLSKQLLRCGT